MGLYCIRIALGGTLYETHTFLHTYTPLSGCTWVFFLLAFLVLPRLFFLFILLFILVLLVAVFLAVLAVVVFVSLVLCYLALPFIPPLRDLNHLVHCHRLRYPRITVTPFGGYPTTSSM